jgi:hypothetical protein
MPDKPTYLGLLNAISLAETRAHEYFDAWIAVTRNPDVCRVLQTVSYREGEHGLAFAKRVNELGFELLQKDDPRHEEAMQVASSDLPDAEKFRRLGLADFQLTFFDSVFSDHTIDIQTGALLGRYIAEEHDTIRRLRECYEALVAGPAPDGASDRVEELCRAVDELHDAVAVQGSAIDDLREAVVAQGRGVDDLRRAVAALGPAPANGSKETKRARH